MTPDRPTNIEAEQSRTKLVPPGHSGPGRNDPCHCGSHLKYKKCHLEGDDLLRRTNDGFGKAMQRATQIFAEELLQAYTDLYSVTAQDLEYISARAHALVACARGTITWDRNFFEELAERMTLAICLQPEKIAQTVPGAIPEPEGQPT